MSAQKILAMAIVAAEGDGHNDAPLFDDLAPTSQETYLHMAQFVLNALNEQGYSVIERRRSTA